MIALIRLHAARVLLVLATGCAPLARKIAPG